MSPYSAPLYFLLGKFQPKFSDFLSEPFVFHAGDVKGLSARVHFW
jgi:hypothetical protein